VAQLQLGGRVPGAGEFDDHCGREPAVRGQAHPAAVRERPVQGSGQLREPAQPQHVQGDPRPAAHRPVRRSDAAQPVHTGGALRQSVSVVRLRRQGAPARTRAHAAGQALHRHRGGRRGTVAGQHAQAAQGDRTVRAQVAESAAGAPPVAGQGGRGPRPARAGGHQRRNAHQPARRAQGGVPEAGGHVQIGAAQAGGAQPVRKAGRREQGPGAGAGVASASAVPAAVRHPRATHQEQDTAERR